MHGRIKKRPPEGGRIAAYELLALHGGVAFAAIDGTVFARLEGHLGGRAAVRADRVVHFAGAAVVPRSLVRLTALTAAGRFILETLLGIEFLFAGGEHKFLAAVAADQRFVLIHVFLNPLIEMNVGWRADLVFDPTLAGRNLAHSLKAPTPFSRALPRGRTYL